MANESQRQREAKQLQGNGLLSALFEEYRRECYEAWQAAPTPEARERLHALQDAATSVEELISAKCREIAAGDGGDESSEAGDGSATRDSTAEGRSIGREP